jgi:hypothetical protein
VRLPRPGVASCSIKPKGIAAIDMFVVAAASFRLLYVMIILAHDRRKIVRFDVTLHPTAGWLSRQVTEAFPWDTAPRYLLRDRDASYGRYFRSGSRRWGYELPLANCCLSRYAVHPRKLGIRGCPKSIQGRPF